MGHHLCHTPYLQVLLIKLIIFIFTQPQESFLFLTTPAATAASNQVLVIRSLVGATNLIKSTSKKWPIGTGTFTTTYTLSAHGSIVLHSDGGTDTEIL